jgi:hypothetical protein
MADWLRSVLVATAVLIALWGLLVALALRYAARRVPREVLLEAWPGEPRLLERLLGPPAGRLPTR